ncbi:TolB protein [Algoriphagus boseongensis]|uniref:TolB protein n=1 Tax=Algoriphagus boseongensis TaxID=1442587 RepID=A0A4V3D242_9BACT|nr:PD40 domain-containing protein [Algoriphagus boseongensis]TDQ16940.1 TolB protein [Algoriphagus boseongensis]
MKSYQYLILALLFFGCNQTEKDISNEEYLIAYNTFEPDSSAEDNWEIRILDPKDSLGSKNLTHHPDVAWTYLAFEDKIYFISDRDTAYRHFFLYQMDAEGNQVKKLSDLRLEDSWMDIDTVRNEMLVSARPEQSIRYQLYLINLQDGSFSPLANDTSFRFQDPVFSPDGSQIAFVKRPVAQIEGVFPEVFLMNREGTNQRQLTHFPKDDPAANSYGYKAGALRWHPTENFISYATTRGDITSIFAITPDGNKNWKISESGKDEVYHDWSPDGKWFAFDQFQDTISKQYHIVLMEWRTKKTRILTDTLVKTQLAPVFLRKKL